MSHLSKNLAVAVERWSRVWRVPGLPAKVSFSRNDRLKTTIARWLEDPQCVELGPRFFALRSRREEILCHELAHAAAILLHGRGIAPHGPQWCALVEAAGFSPGSRLKTRRRGPQQTRPVPTLLLYEHRCPICHAVRYAKRAMAGWRCVECVGAKLPGQLQIVPRPREVVSR
jgi:predicted SprT family Zn-dependent metalloprotease